MSSQRVDLVEAGLGAGLPLPLQSLQANVAPDVRRKGERDSAPLRDALEAYLREIGRVALLTAAQEVDLAGRMEVGLRAEQLSSDPAGLDIPAILELARRGQTGVGLKRRPQSRPARSAQQSKATAGPQRPG